MADNKATNIIYTGNGPLDAKATPVEKVSDIRSTSKIPIARRYEGMTITVLNVINEASYPIEYWLVGGTANSNWKIKSFSAQPTYSAISGISGAYLTVGLTVSVLFDDKGSDVSRSTDYNDNYGKYAEYYVSAINDSNKGVWIRKKYGNEVIENVEAVVDMLMSKKYGNVVYTTDKIYSYEECGETVWTANVSDIPEGVEYKTYDDGLYAISETVDGVSFDRVLTTEEPQMSITGDDI